MTLASATEWDTRYDMKLNFGFDLYVNCVSFHLDAFSCTLVYKFAWYRFECCFPNVFPLIFVSFFSGGSFRLVFENRQRLTPMKFKWERRGEQAAWLSNYELRIDIIVRLFIYWLHAWLPCAANCISDADRGLWIVDCGID